MLNALQAVYHPYVRDRGLDWEIHIEQVSLCNLQLRQQYLKHPLTHMSAASQTYVAPHHVRLPC